VGTSRSFRAPATPRWQAFVAALVGESADRTRSELFNAAQDWLDALSSPSVASYAQSLGELFESLPGRLVASERPATVVAEAIAEARAKSGLSSADVFAERAFASVVLETIGGATGLGRDAAGEAATRWAEARGESSEELVGNFAGAVFRQFASHFADREAGTLVEAGQSAISTARSTADLSDRVAEVVASVWRQVRVGVAEPTREWSSAVAETVRRGAVLPESGP
jgi:broad specificity phosphatase PhoE